MINEKMHDMLKILYHQRAKKVPETEKPDEDTNQEINTRLTNIEKQITLIQSNHCKTNSRKSRHNDYMAPPPSMMTPIETSNRELRQILTVNKRALKNMEQLTDYINETNDRFYDSINLKFAKIETCCHNNEARWGSLSSSVESAFQKIEKICLNLEKKMDGKVELVTERNATTIEFEEPKGIVDDEDEMGSGSGDYDYNAISRKRQKEREMEREKEKKSTPKPLYCHEVEDGQDGIYHFGVYDQENEQGRYYNHRFCHFGPDGLGWTVIQRRGGGFGYNENFNRSWEDYKAGFGDLKNEFWYGNDYIHKLTNEDGQMMLRVELTDFTGNSKVIDYKRFYVGPEKNYYRLDLDGVTDDLSRSMMYHNGMYFSTFDKPNDQSSSAPCALSYGSGWWFNNCLESNLNGKYFTDPLSSKYTGIIWEHWLGDYSLSSTKLMIRPTQHSDLWINDDAEDMSETPLIPPEDP